MIKLMSNCAMMQKSDGRTNADAGTWTNDDIIGDYEELQEAPENWEEILRGSAHEEGVNFNPGQPQDWDWWIAHERDEQGCPTGVEWLVAQYRELSWYDEYEEDEEDEEEEPEMKVVICSNTEVILDHLNLPDDLAYDDREDVAREFCDAAVVAIEREYPDCEIKYESRFRAYNGGYLYRRPLVADRTQHYEGLGACDDTLFADAEKIARSAAEALAEKLVRLAAEADEMEATCQ